MLNILHRVGTSATPEKVFAALTTIDGLRRWWTSTAKGNPKQGGRIDFGFCEMQVLAATPGEEVHWRCVGGPAEWLDTEVTFRLRKESETYVLFSHSGWREPGEFMHHCSTKWATFLLSLKHEVERGTGRPIPDDLKIIVAEERSA